MRGTSANCSLPFETITLLPSTLIVEPCSVTKRFNLFSILHLPVSVQKASPALPAQVMKSVPSNPAPANVQRLPFATHPAVFLIILLLCLLAHAFFSLRSSTSIFASSWATGTSAAITTLVSISFTGMFIFSSVLTGISPASAFLTSPEALRVIGGGI